MAQRNDASRPAGPAPTLIYVRTGTRGTSDYTSATVQLEGTFAKAARQAGGPGAPPIAIFADYGDDGAFDLETFREIATFLEQHPQEPHRGCAVALNVDAPAEHAREVALATVRLERAGWRVNPPDLSSRGRPQAKRP